MPEKTTLSLELLKRQGAQLIAKGKRKLPHLPPSTLPSGPVGSLLKGSPAIAIMDLLSRGGAAVQNALPTKVRAKLESVIGKH